MPKVLTNGKMKIGAYRFPDRKRPALCVEVGNSVVVYGYFNTIEGANEFMDKVAELLGLEVEDKHETD